MINPPTTKINKKSNKIQNKTFSINQLTDFSQKYHFLNISNKQVKYPMANILSFNSLNQLNINQKQQKKVKQSSSIQNNEDLRYQTYLKEYQQLKNSRHLFQPKQNQVQELIGQFLADQTCSSTPITYKNQKNNNSHIKISKIDLTKIQTASKSRVLQLSKSKSKCKIKQKQIKSPKFKTINIFQKIYKKENKNNKQQISLVSVTKTNQTIDNLATFNKNNKNNQKLEYGYASKKLSFKQKNEKKEQTYNETNNKIKQVNLQKLQTYIQKKKQQKQPKKPIRIQIQIPIQQLQQKNEKKLKDYNIQSSIQLQKQQEQIIKEISQKVMKLLQKNKNIKK